MDLKELKKADAKMEPFFQTAKCFLKKPLSLCISPVNAAVMYVRRRT